MRRHAQGDTIAPLALLRTLLFVVAAVILTASPVVAQTGWEALPRAPIGRRGFHTAVWTGTEMLV
jgi:hypothetical protein